MVPSAHKPSLNNFRNSALSSSAGISFSTTYSYATDRLRPKKRKLQKYEQTYY